VFWRNGKTKVEIIEETAKALRIKNRRKAERNEEDEDF
jgi:hypothetical protein